MTRKPDATTTAELSVRQRQILDLLQAGKVNKEIANELGIGLGTVKQHVVALFKKLNVKNRTMAVSRGKDLRPSAEPVAGLIGDGLLERRPCVVLTLALPETAEAQSVRRLHSSLASLAFDNEAIFLARKGHAGDVIFGAQRSCEHDLLKALTVARTVHGEFAALDPTLAGWLRGGISAGLAVASMHRHGGWTGEAIASAAIATARESANAVAPGLVAFSPEARQLMRALGIGHDPDIPEAARFDALTDLDWTGEREPHALLGREAELDRLHRAVSAAASGAGEVLRLEGETGMGKSSLCLELARMAGACGLPLHFWRCLPDGGGIGVHGARQGAPASFETARDRLLSVQGPAVLILDDVHFLPRADRAGLASAAATAAGQGVLVVLSGRFGGTDSFEGGTALRLGRLPTDAMRRLASEALSATGAVQAHRIAEIVRCAAGVPLFAVELARYPDDPAPPLSLSTLVSMRLDRLGLDRLLLRALAHGAGPQSPAELAAALKETPQGLLPALEQAIGSGVLMKLADGRVEFSHPMVRRVVAHLALEPA